MKRHVLAEVSPITRFNMCPKSNKDQCLVDDLSFDHRSLSRAARIEEYEDKLLAREEPDLRRLLGGLKDSEKNNLLLDLKLRKLLVNEGRIRRETTARLSNNRRLARH